MKKLNQRGFHIWMIAIIVVVVAGLGFAGWSVYDMNQDTNKTLESVGDSDSSVSSDTVTPTPTATVSESTLDTLRTFCQGDDPNTVVGGVIYVENSNGTFGSCGVGNADDVGGGMLLAVLDSQGAWAEIWSGNGIMDSDLCTQYKIPTAIYSDCPGYYE